MIYVFCVSDLEAFCRVLVVLGFRAVSGVFSPGFGLCRVAGWQMLALSGAVRPTVGVTVGA